MTEHWRSVVLSTESIDRAAASAAMRKAYECADLPAPTRITYAESPMQALLIALAVHGFAREVTYSALANEHALSVWGRIVDGEMSSVMEDLGLTALTSAAAEHVSGALGVVARSSAWTGVRNVTSRFGERVRKVANEQLSAKTGLNAEDVRRGIMDLARQAPREDVSKKRAELDEMSIADVIRDHVLGDAGSQVRRHMSDGAWRVAWDIVRVPLSAASAPVRNAMRQVSTGLQGHWGLGADDANVVAPIVACARLLDLADVTGAVKGLHDVCMHCGWWLPYVDGVIISNRPSALNVDEHHRLHCETGPALAYRDGLKFFAWHGVPVPESVITQPMALTVASILAEANIELRRAMIERFGVGRFMRESGAREIQRDEAGALYLREMPGEEEMVLLRVLNSTPEPDGTRREYWLRVPPAMTSARAAVAWTFGMDAVAYRPLAES